MKIDAETYQKLPEHLKALFQKAPNPSSEEVLAAFPQAPGQMARARTDGADQGNRVFGALKHVANDPRPRGDTGSAARFFYCAKASKNDRGEGNAHPTVKPTELMRYLCRLVTPPGGTVLDPFMGSGSTGKAALLEGFSFVGVEREQESFDTAVARIASAVSQAESKPEPQSDLFSDQAA